MILVSTRAQNYKCIEDSEEVLIEPTVTCLVGKNESGKTAFLETLYRLNPLSSGHRDSFLELYDYPRRNRNADREKIPTIKPIQVVFELEEPDVKAIEDGFGPGILKSRQVTVTKNYNNERHLEVEIIEKAFISHLELPREVTAGVSTIDDLREKLGEIVEGEDKEVGEARQILANLDLQTQVKALIEGRLPQFFYFDEYSILPGRFSIPYLQQTPEEELEADERTALALLRLAGVDSAEFLETEYEARKAALEAAAVQITSEVFEFWSQNKNLRVDIDVDFQAPEEEDRTPPFLDIRIWNDRHQMSLNFGERSSGFIWFFSFLAYFSEFRNKDERVILLLDEPGLGLHAAAQGDLLRFIDERLGSSHQLIYTTHSPFMIKAQELQRIRTVEDQDSGGTKISGDVLTVSRDTVFPLQAALGYQLSQTLFVGPDNLVLEGSSDILYLQILSGHLSAAGRTALNPRWVLVPAGGIDKIPTFIALLGTQLNLAVIVDGRAGGNQRIDSMVQRGLLEPSKLFPLTEITGSREADLEDMFEPGLYLQFLRGSGVADLRVKDLPPGQRIVRRVEQALGRKFDHYLPAAHFLQNQGPLLSGIADKTLDRFERLFEKINTALT